VPLLPEVGGPADVGLHDRVVEADRERAATLRSRAKPGRDQRLPASGTVLHRKFKGQTVVVHVLADGFQYQDRFYKSLSAIARQVFTMWFRAVGGCAYQPQVGRTRFQITCRSLSESRMLEMGLSGLMSGEGKQSAD
jgi:Protein of unknown function (DUF2924)